MNLCYFLLSMRSSFAVFPESNDIVMAKLFISISTKLYNFMPIILLKLFYPGISYKLISLHIRFIYQDISYVNASF